MTAATAPTGGAWWRIGLAFLALGACGYYETKRDIKLTDTEVAETRSELELLEDEQLSLERDRQRLLEQEGATAGKVTELERQLAALDKDLLKANAELDRAHAENRLSRAESDKLKAEYEQLRRDEELARSAALPEAEKQQKLQELRRRKQALIQAIGTLGSS